MMREMMAEKFSIVWHLRFETLMERQQSILMRLV